MYLYNSATRRKEEFVPNHPDIVKMYTCGPTVYHFAHIGNLRSYIMEDVLEKYLRFAGYDFEVFHTPGHTPGCCCYYVKSEGVLFSGDTLFAGSVGRSDFPGSSASGLIRSVREKLLPLPDDTHVYPGHMGETMIGHERKNNPFL